MTRFRNICYRKHLKTQNLDRNPQRYSAVAWHPSVATQVVVACEDDHSPVLQQWDLRNNLAPVHEYEGHSKACDFCSGPCFMVEGYRVSSILRTRAKPEYLPCPWLTLG